MGKKLIINCGTCDTRNVAEETLNAYESVVINCGDVLVTPESKLILNSHGVTMNCGNILELEKDVRLQSVNGKHQIRSTDMAVDRIFLDVNGKLDIGPGTQEVLKQYVGISVNGKVLCPESVSGSLGMLDVNGKTVVYPDEAIVLKKDAVIDRTFALRAKEKLYWSEKRFIFVDSRLDPAQLATKGAFFQAEEAVIAESLVEGLIDRISEQTEIVIVPDGTAVATDSVKLDAAAAKKYGSRLYVLGDMNIEQEAAPWLEAVEYLNIRGDARVPKGLQKLLLEKAEEIGGEVQIKKGCYFSEKLSLRITKNMLEQEPEGIQAEDCVNVRLDGDIPNALILERLSLRSCVTVRCTPAQEEAVSMVCSDVVSVRTGEKENEEDDALGIGGMLKGFLGGAKELLDTKIINTGDYIL